MAFRGIHPDISVFYSFGVWKNEVLSNMKCTPWWCDACHRVMDDELLRATFGILEFRLRFETGSDALRLTQDPMTSIGYYHPNLAVVVVRCLSSHYGLSVVLNKN